MSDTPSKQPDFLATLFQGRAGRRQFWGFYAFFVGPALGLAIIGLLSQRGNLREVMFFIAAIWALLMLVPVTAAMARRLHDMGRSGRWALPQLFAIVAFMLAGLIMPSLTRPPSLLSCIDLGFVMSSGEIRARPNERTQEEQAECDAYHARRAAFDNRIARFGLVGGIALAVVHFLTLGFLLGPSQPGTNRYGPNPLEPSI